MRIPPKPGLFLIVALLSFLPAFTNAKLAGLQPLDFVLLGLLALCLSKWLCAGFKFRISKKISRLYRQYAVLLLVLFCFAVLAFRLDFFPLIDVSILSMSLY